MNFYLITKNNGEVVASTYVTNNDTDFNQSDEEIVSNRVEDAIEDGYLNYENYEIKLSNSLFDDYAMYKSFVKEMKNLWKGSFVEI